MELDDRLHRKPERKRHDDFKDAVLCAASMPIYRISAQQAYDPLQLAEDIERLIAGQS